MSTFWKNYYKCSVCGRVSTFKVLSSSTALGEPDLDSRPPKLIRNTMWSWVQECPGCGYVSEEISDPASVSVDWLKSDNYLNCDGIDFKTVLAKRYYRYYLLCSEDGRPMGACLAALFAAWVCDDSKDNNNAIKCRKIAISLLTKIIDEEQGDTDNLVLIKADLLRRAGLFDEAINYCASTTITDERIRRLLDFEKIRATKKDNACYTVSLVRSDML